VGLKLKDINIEGIVKYKKRMKVRFGKIYKY